MGFDGTDMALEAAEAARLRHQLLEFLKFRVLAAQEEFFDAFAAPQAAAGLRRWLLSQGWRGAAELSDADLLAVLETARHLYVN